jgi:hypothetical protein
LPLSWLIELLPFQSCPAVLMADFDMGSNCIHERENDKQEGGHVRTHDPLLSRKFL